MKNKKILISVVIFLVGFLGLIIFLSSRSEISNVSWEGRDSKGKGTIDFTEKKEKNEQKTKDICTPVSALEMYQKSVIGGNKNLCKCIEEDKIKNDCLNTIEDIEIYNQALSRNDQGLCDNIKEQQRQFSCRKSVRGKINNQASNISKATIISYDLDGKENNDARITADVNVYPAYVKKIDGRERDFSFNFDIVNNGDDQSGLFYSIGLYEVSAETDDLATLDHRSYEDEINIKSGEVVHKGIIYTLPGSLEGSYVAKIVLAQKSGVELSSNSFEKINVSSSAGIFVNSKECFLIVDTVRDKKFSIFSGIDIDSDEKLSIQCNAIKNNEAQDKIFYPQFIIKKRTMFGDAIDVRKLEKESIVADGTKDFRFLVPTAYDSQSYQADLFFVDDENKEISNKISLRYVIRGGSATIQNVDLDKNSYAKGDVIKLNLFASGSADNFPGSRLEKEQFENNKEIVSRKQKIKAEISINSENGKCIDDFKYDFENTVEKIFELKAKEDCFEPVIFATLKDENGKVLDERSFDFGNGKTETHKESKTEKDLLVKNINSDNKMFIVFIVGLISLLLIILLYKLKSKGLNVLLMIFVVFFALFHDADAVSFGYDTEDYFRGYANLSSNSYSAGENVSVTVGGMMFTCGNLNFHYKVWYQVDGTDYLDWLRTQSANNWEYLYKNQSDNPTNIIDFNPPPNGDHTWHYRSAPQTTKNIGSFSAGNHVLNLLFYHHNRGDGHNTNGFRMLSIPFVVIPDEGHCNISTMGNYAWNATSFRGSLCTSGTQSPAVVNFPSSYGQTVSWDCLGSDPSRSEFNCSAFREVPPPSVSLSADPSSLTNLNNDSSTIGTRETTLTWTIADTSICGTGCTCDLSGPAGTISNQPYPSQRTYAAQLGRGSHGFSVVCRNSYNSQGNTATATVIGSCNQFDYSTPCDKQCGVGSISNRRIEVDCDDVLLNEVQCNLGECPVSSEWKEVKP